MKLIWHAEGLLERDWLRELLGPVVENEIYDLDLDCYEDDSIHVVSSNWKPLPTYEKYFQNCRARCRHIVLFHASDEWFSGGYGLYQYFDGVVRNFHTYLASSDGILTIPEGYSNGTQPGGPLRPADERPYAWSFVGEIKTSRIEMVQAFRSLHPHFLTATDSISKPDRKTLSKQQFDGVLSNSVFSPCPMGNAILETWRLYESLELGCIPLAEIRRGFDYLGNLLGRHPVPLFKTWAEARHYADALYNDKPALLDKQREIGAWWTAHKQVVRDELQGFVTGPSHRATLQHFAQLRRNRLALLHQPLRLAELLRHQNRHSLRRRLARPAAPIRRILADSFRQFVG